jgi:hypothetical protein
MVQPRRCCRRRQADTDNGSNAKQELGRWPQRSLSEFTAFARIGRALCSIAPISRREGRPLTEAGVEGNQSKTQPAVALAILSREVIRSGFSLLGSETLPVLFIVFAESTALRRLNFTHESHLAGIRAETGVRGKNESCPGSPAAGASAAQLASGQRKVDFHIPRE